MADENKRDKTIIEQLEITYKYFDGLQSESKFIREEVFMKEQGFVDEFDQWDEKVPHVIIYVDSKPAATGRLLPGENKDEFIIGRVAVLSEFRRLHLGSLVVKTLENKAISLGGTKVELSAQVRVQGFYERLGYKSEGEVYMDEHCEHILMIKGFTAKTEDGFKRIFNS